MIYSTIWRNKFVGIEATSLKDMADKMKEAAARLEQMSRDGVILDGGQEEDYCRLITTDPVIAARYYMDPEGDD